VVEVKDGDATFISSVDASVGGNIEWTTRLSRLGMTSLCCALTLGPEYGKYAGKRKHCVVHLILEWVNLDNFSNNWVICLNKSTVRSYSNMKEC